MKKVEASRDEAMDQYDLLYRYFDGEATAIEIARLAGVSLRTIFRRIKAYQMDGIDGLSRQTRNDRGQRRYLANETRELIEGLYLRNPKPTIVWIHEQIEKICENDKLPKPSYWVVYQVCREIDDRLKVLAHDGEDAYEKAYEIVIRREANYPNEMWQSDHKELKIWGRNERGRIGKVWITAILDDYSRAVVGYYLEVGTPNSVRISSALRQAIWPKEDSRWVACGIPDILYTDRGRDYKSNHIQQVAADLGIKLVKTKKYKPRGKGKIERFFRTVKDRFSIQYISSRKKPIRLQRLRDDFHEWLMKDYNEKKHSEIKQEPVQKWKDGGIIPRVPDSEDALYMMLLKVGKPRKMWIDGIRFNNRRYSSLLLSNSVREEFSIRYDPRDASCIWVFGEEGKLVCKATCEELTGEKIEIEEVAEQRSQIKKELKKKIKKSQKKANYLFKRSEDLEQPGPKLERKPEPKRRLRKHFHEKE